jgi:hypothetical protein
VFLVLRAFASGCTALRGVEAVSSGIPAFRPTKSRSTIDFSRDIAYSRSPAEG